MKVAVLGSGSWGTTFAAVVADAGHDVVIWGRDLDAVKSIRDSHENPAYLPGVTLPLGVGATVDMVAAVEDAAVVIVAIPSQVARAALAPIAGRLGPEVVAVSLMKGVELSTGYRMSEVLAEVLELPAERVAVVSGPNLAKEIAVHQPTATVVAAPSEASAKLVASVCAADYFRPYTNTDVVGVELCGAVKNVIALAVGIAQGRGYGYNTTATLITRGLAEISRLGIALGADPATFAGLAGAGDLVATCSSPASRNHALGRRIGEGMTLSDAVIATGGTAEGVKSSQSILDLARKHGIDMPITEAVVGLVHGGISVDDMTRALLSRPRKSED